MSVRAQAIIFVEERQARLDEIELPGLGEGQVLVRTLFSGISIGTEGWIFSKRYKNVQFPLVTGYQKTGVVERVGPGVASVAVGDTVFLRSTRIATQINSMWGGHTSYSVEDEASLIPVPEGADPMDASMLVMCAVGYHGAAEVMPIRAGELVVVIGQGLIGQYAAQVSRLRGATVIATDVVDQRLEYSATYSADHIANPKRDDIGALVRQTKPEGADAIIDTSASETAINASFQWLKQRGGRYCFQGYYPELTCLDLFTPHAREITFYNPTNLTPEGMWECMRLLAEDKLVVGPLITHTAAPEAAPRLYDLMMQSPAECLAMVIDWRVAGNRQ
jgi:3-hydroxyethyl bacteriochlorophyllide a dehydrogenase